MLRLSSYLLAVLAGSLIAATAASADEEKWTVSEVAGVAQVAAPMAAAHALHTGDALQPGATLTTGADGKVAFTDGKTVVTMAANSRLTMPTDTSDVMTRFSQDLGSVFFKVEKRPMQHFEVKTLLVAAVVKGTQFTVTASATEHAVDVTEGLVEVVAMNGGQKEMVPAGRSAHVRADAPTKLQLAGDPPGTGKVTRAIGVEPVDYASVTNGLVTATTPAVTTISEGGSNGSNETQSAATGAVALLDGATSAVGGVVADVGSGVGNAGNGGGVGLGVDAGAGAGGGSGVGVGVEVGAGAGAGGAGAGASVGVGSGSTGVGVGVGIGVGLTGGTAPGASGGSGGTGGIGIGIGVGTGGSGGNGGIGIGVGVGVGSGNSGGGKSSGSGGGG